ncbi:MAG: D-alanyl-lipoteichoic acid biosynthesis protein DltD [Clostridiales Family XIII bacterium]|jgi:D-alanine transfer protein|nr:D-alanyl-lipoteichoic acid biosynthesis protein DltD [Clostridiales Family XIII bacterium]
MKIRGKVFMAVLPLCIAVLLAISCFFLPIGESKFADSRLDRAASSLSTSILKGEAVKNRAMEREKYIPFFGSSELRRFDAFHPSILAKKYDRGYKPFLLGTAGTQSITHFLSIHSMGEALLNKKAVFVISPQWFQKGGVDEPSVEEFFSPIQFYDWICNTNEDSEATAYFARRMLMFTFIQNDDFLRGILERFAEGEELGPIQRQRCENRLKLLRAEDAFFGWFFAENHEDEIHAQTKDLPDRYDLTALDKSAILAGKKDAAGNMFHIKNSFYNWRIKPKLKAFKGEQKNLTYDKSPEYGDIQLVLNEFARNRVNVLFVIPPVNQRWADYTGLSQAMYDRFVKKLKAQLYNQGFRNILDLSKRGRVKYFMEDTIHLGWRGWVAMDRSVKPFLENDEPAPEYNINSYYYSAEWQQKVMDEQ